MRTEVLIVGGGVIGCAIAYNLCKRAVDVTVLEQGAIGAQASSAAAGLLAPLGPLSGPGPFADLLLASFALFPSLVAELEEVSGIRIGYEQTGALRVVRHPRRISHLQKRMKAWQPLGLQMYWLTRDEARQYEPLLAPDICAAIYAPEESQIHAPQMVKALAMAASNLGAKLYAQTEVIAIQHNNTRVSGVQTAQGETIECYHIILANGAWAARSAAWLNINLPVSPLRGQILSLGEPAPPLRHLIFGDAAYIAPKGRSVIVGATKEEAGFNVEITAEGTSWLRDTATRLVPILAQSSIKTSWAGLRPKTPDTRPILGPAPHWENVTLATGHNSVGILLSAITGQTIAELVTTGQTPAILRPFSLERFVGKQVLEGREDNS